MLPHSNCLAKRSFNTGTVKRTLSAEFLQPHQDRVDETSTLCTQAPPRQIDSLESPRSKQHINQSKLNVRHFGDQR